MTRLALLADIHGNMPAFDAVLQDLAQVHVDGTVVAGDLIGRGPFTLQVLEHVTRAGWPLIRGNHELYVLDYDTPRAPPSWRDHTMTPWLRGYLGTRWLNTLACWPDTLCLRFPDAPPLRVFHGSPQSAFSGIFHSDSDAKVRATLADVAEDTVVVAHTHLSLDRSVDRWHILNPGSIGLPLNGEHTASYMLLEGDGDGWRATHHQVPFDYDALYAEIERSDMMEVCGVTGRIVLREFETARPQFAPAIRWHTEHHPNMPWSDALFDAFTQANHWLYQTLAYHVNVGQPVYHLDSGEGAPIELQRVTSNDISIVMDILNEAAHWLTERGIDQWRPDSFPANRIAESIARGEVYLARQGGTPVATITVQWHDPAIWGERPLDAVYVHRLAVRRAAAGKGLGIRLLRWAEELAADVGKSFVRLDCLDTNTALCRFYESRGFTNQGRIAGDHWSVQRFERQIVSI